MDMGLNINIHTRDPNVESPPTIVEWNEWVRRYHQCLRDQARGLRRGEQCRYPSTPRPRSGPPRSTRSSNELNFLTRRFDPNATHLVKRRVTKAFGLRGLPHTRRVSRSTLVRIRRELCALAQAASAKDSRHYVKFCKHANDALVRFKNRDTFWIRLS